jgi:hypothetical protein
LLPSLETGQDEIDTIRITFLQTEQFLDLYTISVPVGVQRDTDRDRKAFREAKQPLEIHTDHCLEKETQTRALTTEKECALLALEGAPSL